MLINEQCNLIVEQKAIASRSLKRLVMVDLYLPKNICDPSGLSLLLINDGQDLDEIPFDKLYNDLLQQKLVQPMICVGIHANKNRKHEYGTANQLDYAGRGTKAKAFQLFVLHELLPFIKNEYAISEFKTQGYAGFSLGGLSALDTVWNHPDVFSRVGVFSGSLWWRSKSLQDDYDDDKHRIMHHEIRQGKYEPGLKFFFTTGSLDETEDRNNNGVIDSIDDTLDLINELEKIGYERDEDIQYINYEDGKHDITTWGRALPGFLKWGWGVKERSAERIMSDE